MTPKRQALYLSVIFACLCFRKSLSIKSKIDFCQKKKKKLSLGFELNFSLPSPKDWLFGF